MTSQHVWLSFFFQVVLLDLRFLMWKILKTLERVNNLFRGVNYVFACGTKITLHSMEWKRQSD